MRRNEKRHEDAMQRAYQEEIFKNREQVSQRSRYAKEKYFNSLISAGEVEKLEKTFEQLGEIQIGSISNNPFRQQLYAIIIGIAIATRAALDGGLEEEEAYTLSDVYIREVDTCNTTELLWKSYTNMVLDFAQRVRNSKSKEKVSDTIEAVNDYILRHLHYEISLHDVSEHVGLSANYLCAIYKKETGETISEFIKKRRVEEAQSMLRYSEYSLAEISQYLGFCSQSHFSRIFKEYTEMSPGKFRKLYFKRSW